MIEESNLLLTDPLLAPANCGIEHNEQYGGTSGADFAACLVEAIRAINHSIYPERIPQGSSGSYFVKNLQGEKIGVFKPKNEEPYGKLNPKWLKWFHKVFFPCCFGRSCLVPNQGYLSEAGASLVDQKLGLNVVPKTAVISLAAPTFNYSRVHRAMARTKERIRDRYPGIGRHFRRVGLPPKRGSFQLFVNGYKDATYWLRQWELYPEMAPPATTMKEFQLEFERMVVLDYIIRNTDRGNDNWLIRYEPANISERENGAGKEGESTPDSSNGIRRTETLKRLKEELGNEPMKFADGAKLIDIQDERTLMHKKGTDEAPKMPENKQKEANGNEQQTEEESWQSVDMPRVKIAAIDNGLAFPFKHPDQWRGYPYRWANLPMAQKPFSEKTIQKILPLIDNTDFVRELGNDLRKIFETDPGFDKKTFAKQLSLIRGQMFNLREALRTRKSPLQLVQMTPQYMIEIKKKNRRKLRKKLAKSFGSSNQTVVTTTTEIGPSSNVTITEQPIAAPGQTNNKNTHGNKEGTIVDVDGTENTSEGTSTLVPDTHTLPCSSTTSITLIRPAEDGGPAPVLTEDELDDPKSWHNTFQQKVQTRSPFFAMW